MEEFMGVYRRTFRGKFLFLFFVIAVLLAIGTFFYHFAEGWSYMDSFYFAAISLSTRGYGELHPTTALSMIFTVFYLFIGVAFVLYALSSLIGYYMQNQENKITERVDKIVNTFSPPKPKEKWIMLKLPKFQNNPFQRRKM